MHFATDAELDPPCPLASRWRGDCLIRKGEVRDELAEYVKAHTTPDERIFLFGINGAGVYFAADRLTAHRFLRVNFFVETSFPDPRFRLEAVVADLAERQPRYLIFERLHSLSAMGVAADSLIEHPALSALLSGYTLETRIEDFTLFRRNTDTASGTR